MKFVTVQYEGKLSQLNFENSIYNVSSSYIIYVFRMLSLGRILISNLVVINLFNYFQTLLGCIFFAPKVFCVRYHHFCKVNNICYKQQINTSSCRESTQHIAVQLFTTHKHTYKNKNCNLYRQHQSMRNLVLAR